MMKYWKLWLVIFNLILLTACSTTHTRHPEEVDGPPQTNVDISKIPNAVPKVTEFSRYGNPASYNALGRKYHVMHNSNGYRERGFASWYGTKFHHKRTSSGEAYDMFGMTAAHRTLPIPCYVRVTNLANGKQVIVKVNDRGPFKHDRLIDLSYVAAKKLEIYGHGTGLVEVSTIDLQRTSYTTPTIKPTKQSRMFVQIGAFSKRANALKLVRQITQLTAAPIHLQTNHQGRTSVYRLQVGPIATVALVDKLHAKIRSKGLGKPITVIQ